MTITTTVTDKAASRPQPAAYAEPDGAKSVKDSISVLKEQPGSTKDTNNTERTAPSQKATTTRPKRAHTLEPANAETTMDWSQEVEEAFAKSSALARTPPQTCCTPPDVTMAPKKKEATPTMMPRGLNTTSATTTQPSKQNNEAIPTPPPGDLIDALKKVQAILSQSTIKKEQKPNAQQTIGWAIDHIIATSDKLREYQEQEQKRKKSPTEDSTRLTNIENELAKLRKAITEPPQTYAQAVQRNAAITANSAGNHHPHLEQGVKERMEKLRQERAKTEVALTTCNATDNMKNQFTNMSEEALMNSFQQAITAAGMEQIKIRRVQKMSDHRLKIRCATDKEAEELRSMDWKQAFEGIDVAETLYGIVIHGVSKHDIDFTKSEPEEIMARIRDGNSEEITVERVTPLRRRTRNPNAPTQSIVIFLKSSKQADVCIEMGIYVEHRYYATVERYIPQCQIKQCFKCQAYGHKASVCTKKARCGKCAHEHETKECQSETTLCANCKGSHCA